jgi:uncharacterized protein YggE
MTIRTMTLPISGALIALTIGLLGPARSQEMLRPAPMMAISEGITAQGHGEIKVKPDIAQVTVAVTTQSKDQAEAVSQNATRTTATLAALRGSGIAEKDIQTQSYTVQPQYDYRVSPAVLTGYQVTNSVQATVRDLTKVGLVIDKAIGAGASEVNNVSFDLADRTQAQAQALAIAVVTAKIKATVMAQAAGVDLGRLMTMTEGSAPAVQLVQPVFMRAMAKSADAATTPIADQQITVTADATLTYAMGAAKTP